MQLTMTVLRCPDAVVPETRSVSGGEFSVGRGPGVDWVLHDPERMLSKRHFAVAFRSGGWQIADTSTNGTFMNRDSDAIGAGDVRSLRDGDRLRLGAYEIEVRLTEDAVGRAGAGMGGGAGAGAGAGASNSPFGDPFGMDPFQPAPRARNPFDEPDHPSLRILPNSAQLPHDYDPLLGSEPEDAPFRGPTQADHSPVMQDAFHAQAQVGQMPLHAGGIIPGDDLLPDDWDKDLLEGISPGAGAAPAPAAPPPAPPAAPPVAPIARAAPPPVHVMHRRHWNRSRSRRRQSRRSRNPGRLRSVTSPHLHSTSRPWASWPRPQRRSPPHPRRRRLPRLAVPRRHPLRNRSPSPMTELCLPPSWKVLACRMPGRRIRRQPWWRWARRSGTWSRACAR